MTPASEWAQDSAIALLLFNIVLLMIRVSRLERKIRDAGKVSGGEQPTEEKK